MRKLHSTPLASVLLPALIVGAKLAAQPAAADGMLALSFNGAAAGVEGSLSAGGPNFQHRGPFEVFEISLSARSRYRMELTSSDFDTYLIVARNVRGITEELASDDDGGADGTNSLLFFAPSEDGSVIVVVQSYRVGEGGRYNLQIRELTAQPPRQPTVVAIGDVLPGFLGEESAIDPSGYRYERYVFSGAADDRVMFQASSDQFDTTLRLAAVTSGDTALIALGDDSGGSSDALVVSTLPVADSYYVDVSSFDPEESGSFTLLTDRRIQTQVIPRPITAGQLLESELSTESWLRSTGGFADYWSIDLNEDEQISVSVHSTDFDTYLAIGRMEDGEFVALESDDDGGEGTDSELVFIPPGSGSYVVEVSSFSDGSTGDYQIRAANSR